MLVGAGIGVTPFASILQSIMVQYRNARQVCPRCNHGWTGSVPATVMRLKKVRTMTIYGQCMALGTLWSCSWYIMSNNYTVVYFGFISGGLLLDKSSSKVF